MTGSLGGFARVGGVSESRTIIVMRHAKAEQGGPSDFERQLTDRGMADAAAAGTWLAERGVVPDHALVSAAVRTQQTWEALADGGRLGPGGRPGRRAVRRRAGERARPDPRPCRDHVRR